MKTDRELLELAAKAAGIPCDEVGPYKDAKRIDFEDYGCVEQEVRYAWNPLADDGDALRLAVKLKMKLWHSDCGAYADHESLPEDMRPCREDARNDRNAATRRTIVRAAAEIQRQREASK